MCTRLEKRDQPCAPKRASGPVRGRNTAQGWQQNNQPCANCGTNRAQNCQPCAKRSPTLRKLPTLCKKGHQPCAAANLARKGSPTVRKLPTLREKGHQPCANLCERARWIYRNGGLQSVAATTGLAACGRNLLIVSRLCIYPQAKSPGGKCLTYSLSGACLHGDARL